MRYYFIIILFFSFYCTPAIAQNNYRGIIKNSATDQPLVGVTIIVANNAIAVSDTAGKFQLDDSSSKISISFSSIGFLTQTNNYKQGQFINVALRSSATFLQPAIVTAFERNTTLKNIPVSVSILGKADLERYSDASILQAVNTVPGVKMDERSPGSYRLSIRGNLLRSPFGVRNVKVYWNGIPFTDANGNTYLNQLDFNNVGKIEIIKGPGGSLYGAGTGGVLLLNSRNSEKNEHNISVNTIAGSWGMLATNVAYFNATEHANTNLSFSHQENAGWRNHTTMRRDVANYTGTFELNKKQTFSTNIFYSDLYYQTPGGLTQAQMLVSPRQSRPAAGAFKSAADQQAAIYVKTFYAGLAQAYKFNDDWSNTTSIYTSNTRFKNPSILNFQRKTEQGIGARSVTQYHKNKLTLNFGGEYQYAFTSSRTFGNKFGISDTLQFDDEIGATQYNLFLQTDISLDENLIINAGLSYNNFQYGFTRLNQRPVQTINKSFDPIVVPRISILKKIAKIGSFYATVSQGYSPPTIDEIVPSAGIFNSTLAAEKAINYELGFRGEFVKNKLFIDASYYIFYLKNTIVTRREASGADYFVNTGNTKQNGLEAMITYYPVRKNIGFIREFKLWGNYTNISAKFKSYKQITADYSGNKLTGTPPNVVVLGADITTNTGLYTHITYSYTDVLPLNDANTFFASQYNLLMGRVGYKKKLSKVIEGDIYFSFDHSFNQPYSLGNDLNAAGNRYFNPSAPENYFGGVKLKFNL